MLRCQLKNVSLENCHCTKEIGLGGVANKNIKTAVVALTHLFLLSSVMAAEDLMGLN